jgi:DNA-binding MarR family transcriptional regulator
LVLRAYLLTSHLVNGLLAPAGQSDTTATDSTIPPPIIMDLEDMLAVDRTTLADMAKKIEQSDNICRQPELIRFRIDVLSLTRNTLDT